MKLWLLALALTSLAVGAWPRSEAKEVLLLIGGDSHGYLSPCGCTKPMSGGIRRRAAAVRNLATGKPALVLENGGLVHGLGRQDQLKAETISEALKAMDCDAVNLTSSEAAMGRGMVESIARLTNNKLTSSSIANQVGLPITEALEEEGIWVAGLSIKANAIATDLTDRPVNLDEALETLETRAAQAKEPLVVMLEGQESDARALAKSHPAIRVIVYSALGDPPSAPTQEGNTLLVTPGEHGKSVIRLKYRDHKFQDYAVIKLDPDIPDDPSVSRFYDRYLDRVTNEKLMDAMPRIAGPKFAGTATCGMCHGDALETWKKSAHSHALKTLESEKHGRDPDCVACHVVGVDNENGFRSRDLTPELADVNCESCHGPGNDHANDPAKFPLPKVGEASCMKCHVKEQSPNFDFLKYWEKIKH